MSDGCDHVGYPEMVEMAEKYLRERAIPEPEWEDRGFSYGENVHTPYWAAIFFEVHRRDGDWVLTRMDRLKDDLPAEKLGLQETSRNRGETNP